MENGKDASMSKMTDAKAVFTDAVAAWHLNDLSNATDHCNPLRNNGAVELGRPLPDAEREESVKRGGDGKVALFDGDGWLTTENETEGVNLSPEVFSIAMRLRATKEGGIFTTNFFSLVVFGEGLLIGYLGVKAGDSELYRDIPMTKISFDQWHDVIVRLENKHLECYVDGVLMDRLALKETPHAVFSGPAVIGGYYPQEPKLPDFPEEIQNGIWRSLFSGAIDHLAFWNRGLTDAEITGLSGVAAVQKPQQKADWQKAIDDYCLFYDASRDKDIAECEVLGLSMRRFLARDPHRPVYHFTAPMGFLSDPSGAFYYKGQYHIFSYRNIMVRLSCMDLDHYVSDDLIHWKDRPVAAWADCDLDLYGIWLTNKFIDDEGVPGMIYTAHGRKGKIGILARSRDDLVSFGEKEAVMTDFVHHDGHAWKEGDTWYSLTTRQLWGKRPGDLGDEVVIYSSSDLRNWTERGVVFQMKKISDPVISEQKWGFTEFPYLIPFGEKYALMTGMRPVIYWVGHYDKKNFVFVPDETEPKLLDYLNPVHCFNPLTVDDKGPNGTPRRIIYAAHPTGAGQVDAIPWNGLHVLPRILSLQGNRLLQEPVPEVEMLRGKHIFSRDITVAPGDEGLVTEVRGDALEIIVAFEPRDANRFGLIVRKSDDGQSSTRIYYDVPSGNFGVENNIIEPAPHKEMGSGPAYIERGEPVGMRVFLDKCLLEVFVNGHTCSGIFAGDPKDTGLDLFSEGAAATVTSLDIWEMRAAWPLTAKG